MAKKKETPAAEEAASVSETISIEKQAAPETPERLIYLGPNIAGGALQRYTVFKGGLPKHIKALFTGKAYLRLFVEPAKMAETMQKIERKGTPERMIYEKIRGGKA